MEGVFKGWLEGAVRVVLGYESLEKEIMDNY
jgi:hypothetical protein